MLHGFDEHWVLKEFAVLNHEIDARDIHVHDPAGTHVEMANFAVAHLSFGQTDKGPAGMNERIGIFAQQAVIGGLASESDGVGLGFGAVAPSVENDEY